MTSIDVHCRRTTIELYMDINQNLKKNSNEQTNFCICKIGCYQLRACVFGKKESNQKPKRCRVLKSIFHLRLSHINHRHKASHGKQTVSMFAHVNTREHTFPCISVCACIVSIYVESELLVKVRGS